MLSVGHLSRGPAWHELEAGRVIEMRPNLIGWGKGRQNANHRSPQRKSVQTLAVVPHLTGSLQPRPGTKTGPVEKKQRILIFISFS